MSIGFILNNTPLFISKSDIYDITTAESITPDTTTPDTSTPTPDLATRIPVNYSPQQFVLLEQNGQTIYRFYPKKRSYIYDSIVLHRETEVDYLNTALVNVSTNGFVIRTDEGDVITLPPRADVSFGCKYFDLILQRKLDKGEIPDIYIYLNYERLEDIDTPGPETPGPETPGPETPTPDIPDTPDPDTPSQSTNDFPKNEKSGQLKANKYFQLLVEDE